MILRFLYFRRWFFAAQAGMVLLTALYVWWVFAASMKLPITVSPLAYELYLLSILAVPLWSLTLVGIALASVSALPQRWLLYVVHWVFPAVALWQVFRFIGILEFESTLGVPLSQRTVEAIPLLAFGLPAAAALLWALRAVRPRAAAGLSCLCIAAGVLWAIYLLAPHYVAVPTQLPFVQGWARNHGYRAYGQQYSFQACALPPSERTLRDRLLRLTHQKTPQQQDQLFAALPIPPRVAIEIQEAVASEYVNTNNAAAAQAYLVRHLDIPPGFQIGRRRVHIARLQKLNKAFGDAEVQLLAATAEPVQCTCSLAWKNEAEAELASLYLERERYREAYRHIARWRPQGEWSSFGPDTRAREDVLAMTFWKGAFGEH